MTRPLFEDLLARSLAQIPEMETRILADEVARLRARVVELENEVNLLHRQRHAAQDDAANARLLAAGGRLQIVRADAVKFASSLSATGARFDVLFLDPPYKQGWIERLAPLLPQLLANDGALYVEAEYPIETIDACGDWKSVRSGRAGQVFYQLLRRTQHDGA